MNVSQDQQDRLPAACDLCHMKKSSRHVPDKMRSTSSLWRLHLARARCLRQRPKQSKTGQNKADSDRLDMVLDRLSRLEDSLPRRAFPPASEGSRNGEFARPSVSVSDDLSFIRPPKRRREGSLDGFNPRVRRGPEPSGSSQAPQSPSSSVSDDESGNIRQPSREAVDPRDDELGSIDLQRYLTPSQPDSHPLARDRRRALKEAIKVAKKVAIMQPKADEFGLTVREAFNFYDPSAYPTAEFTHTIIDGMRRNVAMTYYLDTNTNVSTSTLEEMAFALINHQVHGQTRLHYVVCVNHIAYSYLVAIGSESQSTAMQQNLQASKRRYSSTAIAALDAMDLKAPPDIPLLQALLSGAMLLQDMGNMRRCWRLNTAACCVCAALGGRPLSELNTMASAEEAMDTRLAFLKCYIFDKSLSANMYQPSCLADMRLDNSRLDLTRASHAMLYTLLELCKLQEVMVRETAAIRSPSQPTGSTADILSGNEKLRACQTRLQQIFRQTQEFRNQPPSNQDEFLKSEWMNVDFIFSSMMTSFIRLSAKKDDTRSDFECLRHARNALSSLGLLLQIASKPSSYREMCISSLAWIVPLFPLRPIYSIFSNIVATADPLDLKLLQDTADGLEPLAQRNASIRAIYQLCVSLINLCTPFTHSGASGPDSQLSQMGATSLIPNKIDDRQIPRRNIGASDAPFNMNDSGPPIMPNQNGQDFQEQPEPAQSQISFDDDLDWQLFCAQPLPEFIELDAVSFI